MTSLKLVMMTINPHCDNLWCREGRRSSDGLVAQGIVAFQQRLYDKEKAEEVVDLHQVVQKMIRIAVMMTIMEREDYRDDNDDVLKVREEARELAIKFGEEEDVEARETVKTSNYHRLVAIIHLDMI